MSEGWLTVIGLVSTIFGVVLSICAGIMAAKRKVTKWDCNSAVWFAMSMGNFGERQIKKWKHWGGYDEAEAKILIKYQTLSLLGCPIGFVVCGILEYLLLKPQ